MSSFASSLSEDALSVLVHDLRQPLGNIALSASYLEMLLGPGETRIQEQLILIQQQVERASAMLDAAARSRRIAAQFETGESLLLKKAMSAAGA